MATDGSTPDAEQPSNAAAVSGAAPEAATGESAAPATAAADPATPIESAANEKVASAPEGAATNESKPAQPAPAPSKGAKPRTAPKILMLPEHAQNLLQVEVPVSVTLAAKRQPLKYILELAPGSMIQFDKSCEQMLDLCVGDECIAQGVAVKVGEKFGLRVNNLKPPAERLRAVGGKS